MTGSKRPWEREREREKGQEIDKGARNGAGTTAPDGTRRNGRNMTLMWQQEVQICLHWGKRGNLTIRDDPTLFSLEILSQMPLN